MKTAIPLFLIALASVGTLGAKNFAAKPAVVETTVCDLVKRSTHFDKANVRVRAIIMSDLIEHTALVDNECPGKGISLWIPHELDDSADVRALRSELRSQWRYRQVVSRLVQFSTAYSCVSTANSISRFRASTTSTDGSC